MVDIPSRREAAQLIDDLLQCRITNYDFDDRYPQSKDRVVHAIYMAIWFLYDDMHEHRLDGRYKVSAPACADIRRCVLFLNTDIEYTGTSNNLDFTLPFRRLWNWFRGGDAGQEGPIKDGDPWPFESDEQLQKAATSAGTEVQQYRHPI